MDIILERMLSLIPQKPDGKFVHGAKKTFADNIGLNHPQIVSDWIAGRNSSYKNYLYQVSAAYNVSVEWLRGETDEKKPTLKNESELIKSIFPNGITDAQQEAIRFVLGLSDDELKQFIRVGKAMKGE